VNKRIDRSNIKMCIHCGSLLLIEEPTKICPECNFASLVDVEIKPDDPMRRKIEQEIDRGRA